MKILFSTSSFGFLRNFQSTDPAAGGAGPRDPSARRAQRHGRRPEDGRRAGRPSTRRSRPSFLPFEPPSPVVHARHRRCARRSTTGATSIRAGTTRRSCATRGRSMAPAFARRAARTGRSSGSRGSLAVLAARCSARSTGALPPPPEVAEAVRPRSARPAAADAAAVLPLAPGGPRALRARARHQEHRRHRQLGSPDDQGADPRGARPRAGVERGAEAGGDRPARRAGASASSSPARRPTTTGST